jgi:hypothetical protein
MDPTLSATDVPRTRRKSLHARYTGGGKDLFGLALRTGLLTLLTLGIYRFWAKTRVRRFVWSAAEVDGSRFEYTGTGLEKFLGFLIAVVILAIYLGVIQMGLFFFGLTLFREPQSEAEAAGLVAAGYISALAVLPFIFFAIYRARRYQAARTRWRGIRFGMDKAAWGYALRALGYGALTLVSLGLLWPLMTFRLTQYMTDRSWFGDTRFTQEGRWQDLYGAMSGLLLAGAFLVLAGLAGTVDALLGGVLGVIGLVGAVFGYVRYRVQSFAYLTSHTRLGEDIGLGAVPQTGMVVKTYILGSLAVAVLTAIAFSILGAIIGAEAMLSQGVYEGPGLVAAIFGVAGYLVILAGAGAGALALITQPILAHYVTTLSIANPDAIAGIAQRAHDDGADAEGFADALDIGGAI